MTSKNCASLSGLFGVALGLLLLPLAPVWAQTVTATVTVGNGPEDVATNTLTNKIYVVNSIGANRSGNVTVIDGATNSTTTVPVGLDTRAVAVNEITNKIYVANLGNCTLFGNCSSHGSITVIDGATNSTNTIIDPNANGPHAVAVNPVTNKIYVANNLSTNVTVIDGVTNSTTTISDPNANGLDVYAVAVNQVTNKIYVANHGSLFVGTNPGNVTVIDGATNSTTTVTDPNAVGPIAVAVNPVTNKIYVANGGGYPGPNHGNVTVIDGATNSVTTITIDPNAIAPNAVALNQTTNKIYVANANDTALTGVGGVTVIDGTTNAISTIRDPNAWFPNAVAVDSVTNTIYVTSEGCFPDDGCRNPGPVTAIDGPTNSVTTIIDPKAKNPGGLAIDPATDKIYVANIGSSNVTVIDGSKTPSEFTVSVIDYGSGTGTVTSNPPGINCPTTCAASFSLGTMVGLTDSPASGSAFTSWSGLCAGSGACNVTATGFVNATFNTIPPPPDFSLSPASTSLTLQRGAQMTDAMTLAPQNGPFATAIQLTCTVMGPAPLPTCGLNPTSVTPGANSATSTLTITAPVASATLRPTIRWQVKSLYAAWLPLPGIILFGMGFFSRKQRVRSRNLWLLTGSLFTLLAVAAGCAGGSNTPPPPQNYTVTVIGTSGAIQHTTLVTVTVK